MPTRSNIASPLTSPFEPLAKVVKDSITVARFKLLYQFRQRTWLLTGTLGGFFLVAPLVLLGESIVGSNGERLQPFFDLSGYENYTGYLAVPLAFAFMTNSAYSWIGQAIRSEQYSGTLERTLISMRYPSSLMLGGSMAHLAFLGYFITVAIIGVSFVTDLQLNVNWTSALVVAFLHLYAVYGFAFVLTSLFLWIRDAFIVQQSLAFVIIPILAGAGFPVAIFPGWLEAIAKAIPFTWAFDLERQAFLMHTPLSDMTTGLIVLVSISTGLWLIGFAFFRITMRRARRTGTLGLY